MNMVKAARQPNVPLDRVQLVIATNDGGLKRVTGALERTPSGSLVVTTKNHGSYHVKEEDSRWLRYRPNITKKGKGWLVKEGHPQAYSMNHTKPPAPDSHALKAAVRSNIIREIYEAGLPLDKLKTLMLVTAVLAAMAALAGAATAYLAWKSLEVQQAILRILAGG